MTGVKIDESRVKELLLKEAEARGLNVENIEITYAKSPILGLWQRLKLWVTGRVYLYDVKREGWKDFLPFYAFRCPVHGLVETYPRGYAQRLECPKCTGERGG